MNKGFYFFAGVFSTVVLAMLIGVAIAAQSGVIDLPFINANECRADGICEVNSLASTGKVSGTNATFGSLDASYVNGLNIGANSLFSGSYFFSLGDARFEKKVDIYNGPFTVLDPTIGGSLKYFTVNPKTGVFVIRYLAPQNGSAYLCINSQGQVYSSLNPCH